jgi:hypothetical protein
MDLRSKEEFNFFMRRALASNTDDCYIELYNATLRFTENFFNKKKTENWTVTILVCRLLIWFKVEKFCFSNFRRILETFHRRILLQP